MNYQLDTKNKDIDNNIKKYENEKTKGYWLVKYYADWCGHCKTMQPEWNSFKIKNKNNINIAEIESDAIDLMKNKPDIMGFPTVRLYHNGTKISDLKGERNAGNIANFLNNNMVKNKIGGGIVKNRNKTKKKKKKILIIPFRQIIKKKKNKRKTKNKKTKHKKSKKKYLFY